MQYGTLLIGIVGYCTYLFSTAFISLQENRMLRQMARSNVQAAFATQEVCQVLENFTDADKFDVSLDMFRSCLDMF